MGAAVWTSCPAMVLLDLLTDTRYGLGNHITDASLDLFSFVTASKFANTLVDNGLGGQEARFSCNVNIQSAAEAFDLINELSGVMRCMPIWSAGFNDNYNRIKKQMRVIYLTCQMYQKKVLVIQAAI